MATTEDLITRLREFHGPEPRTSDWLTVTQELIDTFANATLDPDWMHINPERAKTDGPFGGTIAFGFWTMSMLTYFNRSLIGADYPEGVLYGFNYGFDRVRLMAPIRVGKRIRDHVRLLHLADKGEGRILVKTEHQIVIEEEETPAMVAEWLVMLVTTGRG